jgi:hypothetical protein
VSVSFRVLLALILATAIACDRPPVPATMEEAPASRPPERRSEIRVVEDGKPVDVGGSVVLRDSRRGTKLGEAALAHGVGSCPELPSELIAEIALDGYCDAILRLKCSDGVVTIPVESLRPGVMIHATPDFTPGIPQCGAIFLQGELAHGCTTFSWSAPSRGRPGAPEWCLDLRGGEIVFGANACEHSTEFWVQTAVERLPYRVPKTLDLGELPIDYAPPIVVARLELPPDAPIPVADLRIGLRWTQRSEGSWSLSEKLRAPVSLELRVHAHLDPEGDGEIEVWWGPFHGLLQECSFAAVPETIRLEWNIWVDTYVSAPDPEMRRATRFECRSTSGQVFPDDEPGKCLFGGLGPGKYTIVAHRPRGGPWTYDFEIPNDQATDRFLIPRLEPFADLKLERK